MQFTRQTLRSTFARFRKALKDQNLDLPLSSAQDTWAQIVMGRNYSAASASLNRHGCIEANDISETNIRAQMRIRNREVDIKTACTLFTAAISSDLIELSNTMYELARVLSKIEGACVIPVHGDITGLGILREGRGGYVPVSTLPFVAGSESDFAWLRTNSDIAVEVINAAAGINFDKTADIFFSSSRAGDKQANQAFFQYFSQRVDVSTHAVVSTILEVFEIGDEPNWDIDFDMVRDNIFCVFDELADDEKWVKPDCDFAEAMIDHLAVRVRETLKWLRDLDEEEKLEYSAQESLEHSVKISMQKFLDAESGKGVTVPS
ncbi:hypothetical protein BCF11_4868 [Collimonas sp. PA-H2]|uniref:hypothetical protein n=1 Tax=Collimonas sp. PA-H2 TaxID=1881062 RepID=UPI000C012F02|nr:hypothetical protein [Collimonas sp. PA-H2]PFH12387.1 hypothetical protein BCF11_4868 [Collimonas sp. PA-H2]